MSGRLQLKSKTKTPSWIPLFLSIPWQNSISRHLALQQLPELGFCLPRATLRMRLMNC